MIFEKYSNSDSLMTYDEIFINLNKIYENSKLKLKLYLLKNFHKQKRVNSKTI